MNIKDKIATILSKHLEVTMDTANHELIEVVNYAALLDALVKLFNERANP